ncbi:hypothetical protein [Aquimarina sp. 433]
MRNLFLLFSLTLLVSCKSDNSNNFLENHDHSKHINHKIRNKKAIEFYNKGVKLLKQQDLDSAKVYFYKSLKQEKNSIVLNELGTMALSKNNYQEALNYFNDGIKQEFEYWPSHINKSRTFILSSHFESAEQTLKSMLLKCESEYWKAYANLHLTYIYTNGILNCKKAKESANKAVFIKNDIELKNQYESIIKEKVKYCD